MTDPYVGKLTFFRVYSGTVKTGDSVLNAATGRSASASAAWSQMHANKREEISEVYAGDIAAGIGFKKVTTGDTLCDPDYPIALEAMHFPEPVIDVAIEPKTKADEEKLANALQRLSEEDPTFRVRTDDETGQTVISGMGELHLEILVDRMMREFGVQANVGKPQVAYRRPSRTDGRAADTASCARPAARAVRRRDDHASSRMEPGKGFVFENKIVGGAIPKEFIPAVEKGVEEAMENGVLAGYPGGGRQGRRCSTARTTRWTRPRWRSRSPARWRSRRRAAKARPRLLEPIMDVEVVVPEEYMGDIIGDLSSRRGRIGGHVHALRCARDRGVGAAVGNVRLRDAPALDLAGPRRVFDAVLAL